MKKLLLLLLLAPSIGFSEGPVYRHKESSTELEFINAYQDIRNIAKVSSNTLPSGSTQYVQNPTSNINGTFIGLGRNHIINGAMTINQRANRAAATVGGYGPADRWTSFISQAGNINVTKETSVVPTGFSHSLKYLVNSADASLGASDLVTIVQHIEGTYTRGLLLGTANAKTVTLSFWVRSSKTGIYCASVRNSAADRYWTKEYTISSADTWEYETIRIPLDQSGTWLTTNGVGMTVMFALMTGTSRQGTAETWSATTAFGTANQVNWMDTANGTFYLTGVQLEIGQQATTFELLPAFPVTFLHCARYFYKTFEPDTDPVSNAGTSGAVEYKVMVAGTAGADGAYLPFPVPMRTQPTMTYYNPSAAGSTWYNQTDGANSGASGNQGSGSRGQFITNAQVAGDGVAERVDIHATADAEL